MYLLTFRLGEALCALPRADVHELLPLPRLDRPPGAPAALKGFFNLGGSAVPVLGLAALLGLPEPADDLYSHLIVVSDALPGRLVALQVERVLDIVHVPKDSLQPLPEDAAPNGCFASETLVAGQPVPVLAVARILIAAEAARLDEMAERAERRLLEWSAMEA